MNIRYTISFLIGLFFWGQVYAQSSATVAFESSNLPIVVINTNGVEIPNDPKLLADMGIIDNGPGVVNQRTDPFNSYNGKVGIEIRGSSSQLFPKKQYGVETWDAAGMDLSVSLLGLPEEADWVLYAPYSDKSLMRNVLTYDLGGKLGRYAPRTRFCEVVINDEYLGVYVLLEKIKRDKNRVDISKLNPDEISGDDLTGGYIIKLDKESNTPVNGWPSAYAPDLNTSGEIFFQYSYPKPADLVDVQKAYIQQFMGAFEDALKSTDFKDPVNGYRKYIDVDSFIDFLIINELTKNVDGYRLSTFMYKDKDSNGGKLNMGPLWDFNISLGNANYCGGGDTQGWMLDFNRNCPDDFWQIPFWWRKLLRDEYFVQKLNARWSELRATVLSESAIMASIDGWNATLSDAQARNFEKWPVFGTYVWPNQFIGDTYLEEVDFLKNWLSDRLQWLDTNIPTLIDTVLPVDPSPDEETVEAYPNPFQNELNFKITNETTVDISISIVDLLGHKVTEIYRPAQGAGTQSISWNGTNYEGNRVAAGLYMYQVSLDQKLRATGKLIRY